MTNSKILEINMKRFIISVLCVAVFFIGLGSLIEKTGARFKSDPKALEILRKARVAIGGDANINNVRSMTILGKTTKTLEIEGVTRTDQGDSELSFELSGRMHKTLKLGAGKGEGNQIIDKQVNVVVITKDSGNMQMKNDDSNNVRKIIIKKSDGDKVINNEDNRVIVRKITVGGGQMPRSNELFRTTLSLLLSAPEGLDVSYTYAGEGSVDGNSCDIIDASDGGSTIKLYLDKSTNLPRMMTFQGHKPFIIKINKDEAKPDTNINVKVMTRENDAPETADYQVKFSDYRSVGGLQFPFKWTQTVGGKDDESTEITSYEVNPSNIAEKFKEQPTKMMIRTK
jgi:hypothetical protein